MKTKSVISALNKILKSTQTIEGNVAYIVGNRRITVIDQGGNAICLPIIDAKVVHNGNYTIKNLVSFITGELDARQVSYLKTLKSMYASTPNERLLEMAKDYQPLKLA